MVRKSKEKKIFHGRKSFLNGRKTVWHNMRKLPCESKTKTSDFIKRQTSTIVVLNSLRNSIAFGFKFAYILPAFDLILSHPIEAPIIESNHAWNFPFLKKAREKDEKFLNYGKKANQRQVKHNFENVMFLRVSSKVEKWCK